MVRNWCWASLVPQMVKNLPSMQETWVRSLGWEDPLEKGMATHSSLLAWRIPWTQEPGEIQSMGLQRVGHSYVTNTFTFHFFRQRETLDVSSTKKRRKLIAILNLPRFYMVASLWESRAPTCLAPYHCKEWWCCFPWEKARNEKIHLYLQ